ncbi:MAG: hypothetical protein COW33_05575, partial [Anaerolineae bacterium CG17_big_fil_post_rev_8_21_14_2_50_57_27]
VNGLRRRGIEVLTAKEAGMLTAPDKKHLEFAAAQGMVIFTQDDDFLRLHASGISHSGIVYAHQRTPIGQIIQGLTLIYQVLTPEELHNHVEFL